MPVVLEMDLRERSPILRIRGHIEKGEEGVGISDIPRLELG
jgi:hypothetical protein